MSDNVKHFVLGISFASLVWIFITIIGLHIFKPKVISEIQYGKMDCIRCIIKNEQSENDD